MGRRRAVDYIDVEPALLEQPEHGRFSFLVQVAGYSRGRFLWPPWTRKKCDSVDQAAPLGIYMRASPARDDTLQCTETHFVSCVQFGAFFVMNTHYKAHHGQRQPLGSVQVPGAVHHIPP